MEENLRVRTLLLQQFGYETLAAGDHRSAVRAAAEENVDLVVIDYHLANGESGEDVARDVRTVKPRVPLIMLTGDVHLPKSAHDSVDAVVVKGLSSPGELF